MAEQDEAPKKSKAKWIILLLLLVIIAGGGYFAYSKFFANKADTTEETQGNGTEQTQKKRKAVEPGMTEHVVLNTFLVNLSDAFARRYLKMTLDVELIDADAAELLRMEEPKVNDRIIMLCSSKTYADISTFEGKLVLKDEIVDRLNQILEDKLVLQVYFTEFVIQ